MTVRELIAALATLDQDATVDVFALTQRGDALLTDDLVITGPDDDNIVTIKVGWP